MGISDRQRRQGVLTITAGERWYANSIARGILSTKRGSEYTLRVLTRYPNDRNVRELERLGAEVVSINYNNVRSLEAALYDTDWLVVVAEDDRNQTRQAAEMARAADRCDVNNIIFMSMEGADNGRTPTQKAYCDMEEIFRDYNESVVIFRPAISQQLFLLWSKAVQEDNIWPWLSNQRGRFVPIHLCDVVESIRCIVCDEEGLMEKLDRRHERKTYRLTGPDSINGNDLIDILNDSVSGGVDLEKVNRRELEEYLRGLRNYAKDTEGRGRGRREPYPEPFLPLSEPQIELIADYFEYVNEGEAGRRSNDVEEITDNKPVPINTFFMDYSDEFKPRDGHRRPGHPGRRPRRGGRRDGRDDYDDHNDRHQRPYNHNINNGIRALVRGSRL